MLSGKASSWIDNAQKNGKEKDPEWKKHIKNSIVWYDRIKNDPLPLAW